MRIEKGAPTLHAYDNGHAQQWRVKWRSDSKCLNNCEGNYHRDGNKDWRRYGANLGLLEGTTREDMRKMDGLRPACERFTEVAGLVCPRPSAQPRVNIQVPHGQDKQPGYDRNRFDSWPV